MGNNSTLVSKIIPNASNNHSIVKIVLLLSTDVHYKCNKPVIIHVVKVIQPFQVCHHMCMVKCENIVQYFNTC